MASNAIFAPTDYYTIPLRAQGVSENRRVLFLFNLTVVPTSTSSCPLQRKPSKTKVSMNTPYEEAKIQLLPHSVDEKWAAEQDDLVNSCDLPPRGQCCHSKKWKRDAFLKAAIIGLAVTTVALIGLFVMSTFCPGTYSLLKRATTQSNDNAFINHKLYIIVICVVGMSLIFPEP